MPGPPKTPTAILKARGSWRAKERDAEPTPELSTPDCPDWLRSEAQIFYNRIAPILEGMRVLSESDRDSLTRYCQTLAKWKEAEEFLMKNGSTFPVYFDTPRYNDDGVQIPKDFKAFPQVSMAAKYNDQLLKTEREFGLTPSARASVNAVPGSTAAPKLGRFFAKRNPTHVVEDNKKEA